jgi:hypothetical protein
MVQFVREGQRVWPTCPECGCRLDTQGDTFLPDDDLILTHFDGPSYKDARGHKCALLNAVWLWSPSQVMRVQ